ncbi:hypothetical protein GCM10023322_53120 [Rugosimonospora acidiphila]|uniref:Uncharacterized protein n=1 Tax=Rugosimonospora acidiphila TaxID=556531 RepID=A0ABP9SAH6_9ACTN
MSTHEIFAAFVVNQPAGAPEPLAPLDWVGELAERAGFALRVGAPDSADPLPYMEGDWLELPVDVRFVEGEDYRALVVALGHSSFTRHAVRSGGAYLEQVVSAFGEACDAIAPTYAYIVTAPEDDIQGYLKQVSVDVHGRDGQALTELGLPLLYVDGTFGTDLRPASPAVRVSTRRGVVLAAGESLTGWL